MIAETRRSLARRLLLVVGFMAATTPAPGQTTPAPTKIAIRAGRLIDGRGGAPIPNAIIVVEGERIVGVGAGLAIPPGATVIDLSRATVLPGLIDCHTHITSGPGSAGDRFRSTFVDAAILAHTYAKATVDAGFTTVRDVGAPQFVDVALRNAINRGDIPGPRILAATMGISATGGHGDDNGLSPYVQLGGFDGIADGVDAIRRKVRFEVKYGADVIKVMATAGAMSEEESVDAALYTQAELDAVVDEAKMWGRRVAAHAHGAEGIKRAVRAGVASIEHGTFLDEEGARLMVERGTYLVKDSYEDRWFLERAPGWGYPKIIIEKLGKIVKGHEAAFKLAMSHGVKIAFGTDAGMLPHGENAKQFRDYIAWGMKPMDAILTATRNAADLVAGATASAQLRRVISPTSSPWMATRSPTSPSWNGSAS